MYFEFANLLVFTGAAALFVVANLVIGRLLLRPGARPTPDKAQIYECGEPTVGQAWVRFDIRFYTVALMFVVFDVEVALLVPWAVVFRDLAERGLGGLAFVEAGAFLVVLMAGLAYVWARGDIDWTPRRSRAEPPAPRRAPPGEGTLSSELRQRQTVLLPAPEVALPPQPGGSHGR